MLTRFIRPSPVALTAGHSSQGQFDEHEAMGSVMTTLFQARAVGCGESITVRRWITPAVVTLVAVWMSAVASSAATIHVSPSGSDSAAGTEQAPLASVQAAVDRATPGDTILLHDGVFVCDRTILLSGSGTPEQPLRLLAASAARPVLCFEPLRRSDEEAERVGSRGILLSGDHWVIEGLEIRHAPDNGLKIEGSHNRVERCVFHHNGDSGLQIGLGKKSENDDGARAAHNAIVNCDSFRNFDARTKGENADGFACKLYPGAGNSFAGCRAWENADDGWDLFMTTFPVTLDRCWAWHNGDPGMFPVQGTYSGDGNGFKLGGQDKPASHLVRRCIAFDHPFGSGNGFEDNNNTAPITLQNCTAWGNRTNFQFKKAAHVLENCVSFAPTKAKSGVAFDADVVCRNNSWKPDPHPQKPGKYLSTLAADEFTGLDAGLAVADRGADGRLPDNGFARPRAGGSLVDVGRDVGLPFAGAAPDLGAVETESSEF